MKEKPILGYDWELGHEEIQLEIGTYDTGKGLYIGMLTKEDGIWESFGDLTVNLPFERSEANEAFIQGFCSREKLEFIKRHKLGKVLPEKGHSGYCTYDNILSVLSGYCTYDKVAFDLKRLEEFDPDGMKRFYEEHPELQEKKQQVKKKKRNEIER